MKSKRLLSLMLLCFAVFGVARAQETLTVHNGTATNGNVPVYGYYADAYLKCEMVYPAAELGDMEAGTITGMTFYASTPATDSWGSANFQVFLTEVADATISAYVGPGTVVYEGALDGTQSEMTITFTTPYVYNGGNLLVGVYNTVTGSYKSITWAGEEVTGASITGYSYTSLDAVSATQRNFLPKTTFEYTPAGGITCNRPTNVAVSYEGSIATATWDGEVSLYNIDVNGTVTNGVTSPYTFAVEPQTTYSVKVQADCGSGDLSSWAYAPSFTTPCAAFALPYEYGFEDAGDMECWSMVDCAGSTGRTTTANYVHEGSAAFCFVYNTNPPQYLISPMFEGTETGLGVSFYYMNPSSSYTETFQVGYSTTTNETSAFTWGTEITASNANANTWFIYEDAFPAGAKFVAVKLNSYDQLRLCLDDFTFEVPSSCRKPTDLNASVVGKRNATISWTENGEATAWQVEVTDLDGGQVTTWNANATTYEIVGLTPDTRYSVRVNPVCDVEKWSDAITFTTEVACPAPTALEVVPTPISATVTWTGDASNYTMRYGTCAEPDPTQPATIIFHADDVWQDGSGYQMLLDADATAYGTTIPETGALSTNCSGNEDIYAEFEYKIPANADGECTTSNIVLDNTITLQIPAGTYDWCITNPTPGDRIWIASTQGNVGGRADDYVFEGGMTYEFHMYLLGSNDATDVTIMCSNVDWTYVDNATSPYTINGLDPETEYFVGVQAVCGGEDGESAWTNTTFTTPSNCDAPTALNVTNLMPTTATLNWTGYQDGYEVWYRPVAQGAELASIDFEDSSMGSWTTIDADGDGYDWVLGSACDGIYLNGGNLAGTGRNDSQDLVVSGSYSNVTGALTPDNYLVSPQVELGGSITFWAAAQDASYAAEVFGVAVSTTSNTDASAFTTIQSFTMTAKGRYINDGSCRTMPIKTRSVLTRSGNRAGGTWYQYTVDLSDYAGQTGYVAIRHYNCTDQFMLDVDDITINGPATEEQEWTMVTTDATSYNAEGLEPETEYEWQVRGENRSCSEDGYTEWSEMGTFTTPGLCDPLASLSIDELTATSITLSWTGYQESYNVQYRTPADADVFFYEDFSGESIAFTFDNFGAANNDFGYASGWYGFEDGTNAIIFFPDTELTSPQYLISNEMEPTVSGTTIEFGAAATATGCVYRLGFSSTDNSISSFTWSDDIAIEDSYVEYEVPVGTKYFAIAYPETNPSDAYGYVVDFMVYANYVPAGEWITFEGVNSPFTIDGLTPETEYEVYVQGVCGEEETTEWLGGYFTTPELTTITQTTNLNAGWNWFSAYVEGDAVALIQALENSLGDKGITIKASEISTDYYDDFGWFGELDALGIVNEQMYLINVSESCTVELQGTPANPANHTITINPGWNWIGFPCAEAVSVAAALAGFEAEEGDVLKGSELSTDYYGEEFGWFGGLETLEPGQGYLYKYNGTTAQTLIFQTGAKRAATTNTLLLKKQIKDQKHNAISRKMMSTKNGVVYDKFQVKVGYNKSIVKNYQQAKLNYKK